MFARTPLHPWRAAGVVGLVCTFFGALASGHIKCPMNALFHVPCPGCGSSRAMHALLDLDVHEALRTNPLAPIAVVAMLVVAARAAWLELKDGSLKRLGEGRFGAFLMSVLVRLVALAIFVWFLRALGLFGGLPDQNV